MLNARYEYSFEIEDEKFVENIQVSAKFGFNSNNKEGFKCSWTHKMLGGAKVLASGCEPPCVSYGHGRHTQLRANQAAEVSNVSTPTCFTE